MRFLCAAILCFAMLGCDMPRDVAGTFSLVRDGKIRVGVTERPPWTRREGSAYSGIEVKLLQQLAEQFNAELQWQEGAESELFEALHHGELDLMIGGLVQSTPWSHYVGLTQPYLESPNPVSGQMEKHVWAVRAGENRWLLEVDRFLRSQQPKILQLVEEARR